MSINPEFDGRLVTQLLTGEDTLKAKSRRKVLVEVSLDPGERPGPYTGKVSAVAASTTGIVVTDETTTPEMLFKTPAARLVENSPDADDGKEEAE